MRCPFDTQRRPGGIPPGLNTVQLFGEAGVDQLDQARGINKALVKMVDYVAKGAVDSKNKVLGITHCNCPARAEIVKDAILKRIPVKDVVLLDTAGVSTMYANDGGVIVVI